MGYSLNLINNCLIITNTDGRSWEINKNIDLFYQDGYFYFNFDDTQLIIRDVEIDQVQGVSPSSDPASLLLQIEQIIPLPPSSGSSAVSVTNFPSSIEVSNQNAFPASIEVSNFPSNQEVNGTVTIDTTTPLNVSVSNSVNISNTTAIPVSVSNSGFDINNLPTTQSISGNVGIIGTVPVSLNTLPSVANQVVSGTVSITGTPTFSNQFVSTTLADGMSNPTVQNVGAYGYQFNGANWDRQRNNTANTVISSTTATTNGNSGAMVNYNSRTAMFFVNITAISGLLATFTVSVQAQDPVSSSWITLPGASTTSISGTGLALLSIGTGLTSIVNSQVNAGLPRNYRIAYSLGGTTPSVTFSVGVQYTN